MNFLIINSYICRKCLFQKNIDKRDKDLELIKAKELKRYEVFVKEFQHKLDMLKNSDVLANDSIFMSLIKNCNLKLDQQKFPFILFLYDTSIIY